jgi:iron complex outermembrane recepter protein
MQYHVRRVFVAAISMSSICQAEPAADADHATVLPTVSVVDKADRAILQPAADTAALLKDVPGIGLYTGGGASSLPVLRGLNDDRIKTTVDGMQITSACANHMNPPLSYIDPANVGSVDVIAGITPVSQGGDNIGGTIAIESALPAFAATGERSHSEGKLSMYYRSQGDAAGMSLYASMASENSSLGYAGAVQHAASYRDGNGDKVRSTQYETRNHALTLATQRESDRLTIKLRHQDIPYQGYVNQYMDMTDNSSNSINIRYEADLGWGNVDARAYWQDVKHKMDFFSSEKTGSMPMETHGKDIGYSLQLELPRSDESTWRFGHDFHRFTLDDWWPPVAGSMMMEPNTYENINNGRRDRFGVFAELESTWNARWSSVLGIRDDLVISGTDDVQPYNFLDLIPMGMGGMATGMDNPDASAAAAFNARGHTQRDNHIDLTALARYEPDRTAAYEFGYARKTRSPNLYERYSWGRGTMAMTMIGWFGDANAYVGDPDLKPETANTLSASADWHDAARQDWQLKITPYYTYVQDYIDAVQIGSFNPLIAMQVTRPELQFANRDVEIYGADASGQAVLWSASGFGRGMVKGTLAWTRGARTGSGSDLYHIMPLNARVSLEQTIAAWTNAIELQLVDRKSKVDAIRDEEQTGGYALVSLRSAYQWKAARIDVGISNLFNKFYYLPLGGVDYADWKAEGATGQFGSVPGAGRSVDIGLALQY